jgi:hypothetical protein
VRAAHGHDLAVHVWTVNERADMERLLDWGVDGIMTDRPDTLAEVLWARGAPAHAPTDHPDMTPSNARNEGQA